MADLKSHVAVRMLVVEGHVVDANTVVAADVEVEGMVGTVAAATVVDPVAADIWVDSACKHIRLGAEAG